MPEKKPSEKLPTKAEIVAAIKVITVAIRSGIINLKDSIELLLQELNKNLVDSICEEGVQTKSLEDVKMELLDQKPGEIIFTIGRTVHGINQAILNKEIHRNLKEYNRPLALNIF